MIHPMTDAPALPARKRKSKARFLAAASWPVSVVKALSCPECGRLLFRSECFWGCPRLHAKLIPDWLLLERLDPVCKMMRSGPYVGVTGKQYLRALRRIQKQEGRSEQSEQSA